MEITTLKKNKVIKHEEKFFKKKKIKRKYETIKMPNHKFQIIEESFDRKDMTFSNFEFSKSVKTLKK